MKRSRTAMIAVLGTLFLVPVAFAGDDMTSLSYISYLERYATIRPAHGDETLDVVVNMPILAGDRLDTARGARVEVQLADGSTLWLDEFTTVDFDAVALSRDDTSPRTALYLADGSAAIEIPATAAGDGSLRFDSPAGAVFLNRPGLYRLELSGSELRVQAHSGFAELPAGLGSDILRAGEEAVIGPPENGIQRASISDVSDDFWTWVQERRHVPTGPTAQYVGARDTGRAAVLDAYGDWVYVPTFSSWMWQPRVSVGWVPYSYGRWYWTPVGWSWISYEPWGWYPFHYGSWYFDASFGWVWGFDSIWGPAWVDWFYSPGYVGWCPRGYYDWWYYHNCNGCWGDGRRSPRRWSEVSFNFSGRVRPGVIDPRPWTVIPSGQFGSTHIDRVRIDARRFFQDGGPDREGLVRSGPLVTPFAGRSPGDRAIDSFFRGGPQTGEVPDLSSIMRREPVTGVRSATSVPRLRLTDTQEITRAVRPIPDLTGATSTGESLPGVTSRRDAHSGIGTGNGTGSVGVRTEVRRRSVATEGGSNPPVVRREVVHRDAPPPSSSRSGGSSGSVSRPSSPPAVERPHSPPAERPRSRFSSSARYDSRQIYERDANRYRDSWASAATRRDVDPRFTARSYAVEPRPSVRSVDTSRSYARAYVPERITATQVHSAPARSTVSHSSSSSGSSYRTSSGSAGRHRP
ncbi:MAG TPA: DUF6600 domain-containing protein [Thermoanaerobaculaceae bacterium]|nr:DUF6600 domain-containing protein [Thermoanaerobaculaceae bacterium]